MEKYSGERVVVERTRRKFGTPIVMILFQRETCHVGFL